MSQIEITKREILVSIVIVLIMLSLGFFIATAIHDKTNSDNEKYFKALKIDNDPELFQYAIQTEVGDIVSYGTIKANEPVSDSMISGKYYALEKVEEHYEKETETVTYTDTDGKTKTKIETHWEWEEYDRTYKHTKTLSYLGQQFNYNFLEFNQYEYIDTVKKSSHVRYKFYGIPVKFKGSMYSKTIKQKLKDNVFYEDKNLKELMEYKEKEAAGNTALFWVIWVLIMGGSVFAFVALENRYLNNSNEQTKQKIKMKK